MSPGQKGGHDEGGREVTGQVDFELWQARKLAIWWKGWNRSRGQLRAPQITAAKPNDLPAVAQIDSSCERLAPLVQPKGARLTYRCGRHDIQSQPGLGA